MIKDTYSELILEQIIRDILKEGTSPSVSEIEERYNAYIEDNDLSLPLFNAQNYHVTYGEPASSSKFNNTYNDILRDFKVVYKHMFKISDQAIRQFDRWRSETSILENRLIQLEDRISSLLLLENETAGYFNFVQDNFNTTTNVDLDNTTTFIDLNKGVVSIGTSDNGATRIDLSSLTNKEVEFAVLTKSNHVSTIPSKGSQRRYAISDVNNYWQEIVYTSKPNPISVELKVNFITKKFISRIDIDLHMANQNSSVQITPMYSLDNYSWNQLAISNYTRSITDKTTFQFTSVEALYFKFILTKTGYDQIHNGLYAYEFGVDEISFYNEAFAENEESVFTSKTLSITKQDGSIEEFSKIACEVCEDIPDDTSIDYYVAVSNTDPVPLTGFVSIDPITRTVSTKPTVLDFGDLSPITISGIKVSHDESSTALQFVNPAKDYTLVESISGSTAVTADASTTTLSGVRYSFLNNNERILDHQFHTDITFATGTLELWRNVNTKGSLLKVRGNINGWGFSEPYYKTVVNVDNANGYSIDFGSKHVVVNEEIKTGIVSFQKGKHSVWVHKDNWKYIDISSVTDLFSLKQADQLYPYNHRYLIEGFNYPGNYPTTDSKIYSGFDIVAEFFMKQVSIFDLINNVLKDDYNKFAIDLDVEDSGRLLDDAAASDTNPTNVFVLKVDDSNPDFMNERFIVKFKAANTLYKYIRFKAVLKTEDSSKTPILDSYRIKIAS